MATARLSLRRRLRLRAAGLGFRAALPVSPRCPPVSSSSLRCVPGVAESLCTPRPATWCSTALSTLSGRRASRFLHTLTAQARHFGRREFAPRPDLQVADFNVADRRPHQFQYLASHRLHHAAYLTVAAFGNAHLDVRIL